jgi:rifampin ADP-ribosylating transferase
MSSGPKRFYHGTRADLKPGDLIAVGYSSNYGTRKQASWVYLTGTLDAAIWGAELAVGEGRERIYIVEPTGPIVDDPNLTEKISWKSYAVLPRPRAAPRSRARSGIGKATPPSG